jgi:hypothetical protein
MYSLYPIHTATQYFLFLKPLSYNREFSYSLFYMVHAVIHKLPPALRTWAIRNFHENNKIMLSSISHSIKQAYKVLTLCAFHYEFYITDSGGITRRKLNLSTEFCSLNRLTPNDPYMGRTAPLTSKRCILYIYSKNIGTENFKYALYSPFFSLQNAVGFIILTCLVPVLFTFYIQGVLKLKNKSGAKGLNLWRRIFF